MTTADQKIAIMKQITKFFCDEPLSIMFLKPLEEDKKLTGEYKNRIKKPMDLTTIKKKINNNQYSGFQPWIEDMNLIWDNAVEFNSADSVIGGVAIYLKKKFNKRIMSINLSNLRNYEQQIINLTKDIQNILQNPPASFGISQTTPLSPKIEQFSLSRVQKLLESVQKLMEQGKSTEIINIIKSNEPGFEADPSTPIDFGEFSRKTLIALEEFVASNTQV
ncbi:Bromodomain containing protein [Trichomonas vaginalis G3]|uniref:Bromodomain containing protein n=1 Tax=Trichomonas vaginalis (strain ATCC PRA-98 / G3) TaxID=412133 RepID=A2ERC9_TRIV3|nr:bromodomain family [Trichomonas vaginalis G3]EAY04805.1 Bromodomain containing protein [Trichomonas vaginalis G3]KAI5491006.1 bromodomain family [Trichomonas vaginalis G3]|eukprot:XP_001317028.1 Bromodomain containing protein [Trichomonas vaginalis G3]